MTKVKYRLHDIKNINNTITFKNKEIKSHKAKNHIQTIKSRDGA